MAYTDYNPTSTSVMTDYDTKDTPTYLQLEPPPGFGLDPFGDEGVERGILIHSRGFGSPLTEYTDV